MLFFLILLLVDVALYVLNGLVLQQLWGWFVIPLFHLPALSLAFAIGLAAVVKLLTHHQITSRKDETLSETVGASISHGLVNPVFVFLVGWAAHLFI